MKQRNFEIDPGIKAWHRPLTQEEYDLLEKQIVEDKAVDPLVIAEVEELDNKRVLAAGHTRLGICEKHEIPYTTRVKKFKTLESLHRWLDEEQDGRRNKTPEELKASRERRIGRVVAARQEGQSIRAIAEAEGISKSQVERDLQDSGVPGGTPEPEGGKTKGQDGKEYPATSPQSAGPRHGSNGTNGTPPALCDRCARVGAVKNCPMCKDMRAKPRAAKKPPKPEPEGEGPKDEFGNVLPKRCRDAFNDPWVQSTYDLLTTTSEKVRMARLGDGMRKREKRFPFFNAKDFADANGFVIQYLDDLIDHMKENRPAGVCPGCAGKGCGHCKMSGLVPRKLYEKLTEKARK